MERYHTSRFYVGLVEASEHHNYQPLWTLVGGGLKKFEESQDKMVHIHSADVQVHQNIVTEFQPEENKVKLLCGRELEYKQLIVALGLNLNWSKISGLNEAIGSRALGVCSNYSAFTVERTWENIQRLTALAKSLPENAPKLEAIFTQPATPIKCAGAPQKIMYIAWSHWEKAGVLDKINITFCTGMAGIFSQPDYAVGLRKLCDERGIRVHYETDLIRVDGENRQAVFTKLQKTYDMLHVTPPQEPLEVCAKSPLSNKDGWIDVCPETLQHQRFKNVWAIGDCSSLPTSKTAAAVAAQCSVLKQNLMDVYENKEPSAKYDGYTSCPLITSTSECILAEFDYKFNRKESLPYDQRKPSKLSFWVKSWLLPRLYWRSHVYGYWSGPAKIANILTRFKGEGGRWHTEELELAAEQAKAQSSEPDTDQFEKSSETSRKSAKKAES